MARRRCKKGGNRRAVEVTEDTQRKEFTPGVPPCPSAVNLLLHVLGAARISRATSRPLTTSTSCSPCGSPPLLTGRSPSAMLSCELQRTMLPRNRNACDWIGDLRFGFGKAELAAETRKAGIIQPLGGPHPNRHISLAFRPVGRKNARQPAHVIGSAIVGQQQPGRITVGAHGQRNANAQGDVFDSQKYGRFVRPAQIRVAGLKTFLAGRRSIVRPQLAARRAPGGT